MRRDLARAALRADEAPMLGDVDGWQFVGQGERVIIVAGLMIAIEPCALDDDGANADAAHVGDCGGWAGVG